MSEWDAIVLDIDGGERLTRCIDSLERQSRTPTRIVLVDNGSLVPASLRITDRSLEVNHVRSETNLGFTGGVNRGWTETTSPLVALVNNDVELDPAWGEELVRAIGSAARIGSAQAIIARPDGTIDGAGVDISTGRFLQLGHGEPAGSRSYEPWGASATAAMFRRRAIEDVRLGQSILHPRFFAYYEDVELAARLERAGWETVLVPQALSRHEGSASSGRLGLRATYLRTRNRYFVTRLHPGVGRTQALMAEDVRKFVRAMTRLNLRRASAVVAGMISGLFAQI